MSKCSANLIRGCIRELFPTFRAAPQRPDTSDPLRSQQQRRTGAGGLVRSTAKENNLPVSWNLVATGAEFLGRNLCGAWYQCVVLPEPATKVDDEKVLSGTEPVPQFLRVDPGYIQLAEKPAALHKLPADPQH